MLSVTANKKSNSTRIWTYQELCDEMRESNQPAELWDGELIMSPSPSYHHQKIVLRFYEELVRTARAGDLGDVIAAPMDMVLSSHRVVQPDIAFICKERFHIIKRVIEGPADLVAEIVSLGGRERDRIEKKDLYEQYGVREYWIIDPEAGTVEVFHLENQAYTLHGQFRAGETATSALLQEFNINVESLLKPS